MDAGCLNGYLTAIRAPVNGLTHAGPLTGERITPLAVYLEDAPLQFEDGRR